MTTHRCHGYDWMHARAEDAASDGLPLDEALQAVRDGYSSVDADRIIAEDLADDELERLGEDRRDEVDGDEADRRAADAGLC